MRQRGSIRWSPLLALVLLGLLHVAARPVWTHETQPPPPEHPANDSAAPDAVPVLSAPPAPSAAPSEPEPAPAGPLPSSPHRSTPTVWTELAPGLSQATLTHGEVSGFRVQAFKLSLRDFDIQAADARTFGTDIKNATVKEMAQRSGAVLAVNSTFFDEHYRPLGLVISRSFRLNPFRRADWGVLAVDDDHATLMHTRDWAEQPPARVWFAVQVGPRLVVDGKPTPLKPQTARRTAIGILPGRAHLVVLVTDRGQASAADLAALMARPGNEGGLGCIDAVAMDGGPSSQLYMKIGHHELFVRGGWPVPMGVVFISKEGKPGAP